MGCESDGRPDGLSRPNEQLLQQLARDRRGAFDEIVALYRHRVSRLVYRLLGWDPDSEDVIQDVFLAALKNLKKFRGDSSLWSWLAAITVNRCRTLRRRRLLRLRLLSGLVRRPAGSTRDSFTNPERRESFERVRDAVRGLPVRLREVTVLRYLEEMSIDEVSDVVGASKGAVQTRLHRARTLLQQKLAPLIEENEE